MLKIQYLRKKNKQTQQQLADILGLGRSTIAMWETGASTPDTESIKKIAEYYNVSADYVLGLTEEIIPLDSHKPCNTKSDLDEYLEELKNREEMRMLFKLAKGASKEDVEKAVKIIETLME